MVLVDGAEVPEGRGEDRPSLPSAAPAAVPQVDVLGQAAGPAALVPLGRRAGRGPS